VSNVVNLPCVTRLDLPPERVLQAALEAGLEGVVVMGYKDGEPYFASTYADGGNVMWLMELLKAKLLKIAGELAGRD
jgi:coenzyme F420-reducing hydrogenase delta subunit